MHRTLYVALAGVLCSLPVLAQTRAPGVIKDGCEDSRDLRLTNGHIVTMDKKNPVVTEVSIRSGRFESTGKSTQKPGPCTQVINLRGRTAVPGLIDNHNHIVLLGLRPGHDTRLETAASIADVQAAIRTRSKGVPAGAFITAMGG